MFHDLIGRLSSLGIVLSDIHECSQVNIVRNLATVCKLFANRDAVIGNLSRHSRRNPFIPVTSVRLSVFILQNAGIRVESSRESEERFADDSSW